MAVLFVTGGKLTFYTGARDTNLVAECGHICHGRCVKTKTMKGPAAHLVSKKGQGRPAGYLAAWLAKGLSPGCDSKVKHWSADIIITKAERRAARNAITCLTQWMPE